MDKRKYWTTPVVLSVLLIAACLQHEPNDSSGLKPRDGLPQTTPEIVATEITFETSPCFGFCPVFSLTIDEDGRGVFEGKEYVSAEGPHEFTANPEELAAFQKRLEPFRPDGSVRYDWQNCSVGVITDAASVEVSWIEGESEDELFWYLGCSEPSLRNLSPDLYRAWEELPVQHLVGSREQYLSGQP